MKQVGLVLDMSERSVRRIIQAGDLPAIRIGGSPRIRSADLRAYLTAPQHTIRATVKNNNNIAIYFIREFVLQ